MVRRKAQGFTLIELSIVLVIIGLLVGGVLVGRDLIKAAGLKVILSEKDQFAAAMYTFRDRYNYLPGDFPNSDTIFGITPGVQSRSGTASGNGNGIIEDWNMPDSVWPYNGENSYFWTQLGSAGLIKGTYPVGTASGNIVPGIEVPPSAYGKESGWSLISDGSYTASTNQFYTGSHYPNAFLFGGGFPNASTSGIPNMRPVLTPTEVFRIDTKIDDGLPAVGKVAVMGATVAPGNGWIGDGNTTYECTTSNDAATAQYAVTLTTATCFILFPNMYP